MDQNETGEPLGRNEVVLVGRVSLSAQLRTLPSGDALVVWRLVVDRPAVVRPRPQGGRVATVDAIDCVARGSAVRRTAGSFTTGDVVLVRGALRRRFWQTGSGAASRYEVEADVAKRLTRAQASR